MIVDSEAAKTPVSSGEKEAALAQILASQTFARSDQLKAFLEFVCAQELKGEGANLSEYLIGVQVLGKPDGYSTAEDATVRTRAHALRRKLSDFYQQENPVPAVRVELPKGSFHHGSPVLPVNWRGDGQEFSMLSANIHEGGMIDGHFRRVVMFPDDGHPDLAYNIINLTGGSRIYAPVRNPDFNESNYRTTVSLPHWVDVK